MAGNELGSLSTLSNEGVGSDLNKVKSLIRQTLNLPWFDIRNEKFI